MFERDKVFHFVGGFVLAFLVGIYNPFLGVGVALLVGLFKEYVKDSGLLGRLIPSAPEWMISLGTVDWRDLAATAVGGYGGALLALISLQ